MAIQIRLESPRLCNTPFSRRIRPRRRPEIQTIFIKIAEVELVMLPGTYGLKYLQQ